MEYEDSEQQMLKEAISFKKDKHRVEIRKKNIQSTLKNKRINHLAQITDIQNLDSNTIINFVECEQGKEITLQFYIDTVNQICMQGDIFANSDKLLICLKALRSHIQLAINSNDKVEIDKLLIEFMKCGGCECILSFFSENYDELPILQSESTTIIGNIFSFTQKPILVLLMERNIGGFLIDILSRQSQRIIGQHEKKDMNVLFQSNQNSIINNMSQFNNNQSDQLSIKIELLSEIFRALANIACENEQYRLDLIQNGLIMYLNSEQFNQICQQLKSNLIEQIVFLIKNMVFETPRLQEEITIEFIPIIAAFFQLPDLSQESTLNLILSIKSYAKPGYGYAISRAKMLSNRDVFLKIHELIDYSKNRDFLTLYYSLQTIRDYMKFSDRQAEFIFNLNRDAIYRNLEYYLKSSQQESNKKGEDKESIIDIQLQAIQILHFYVLSEDEHFFEQIYQNGLNILKQVIFIATYNPDDKINYPAKDLLYSCINKANYEQQKHLVELGLLQPIKDSITEDQDLSLVQKALHASYYLLAVAQSQIGQSPDFIQHNYLKEILDTQYQFQEVLEHVQGHKNNQIHEQALNILENFYFKQN